MADFPTRLRHFPKTAGLVNETSQDISATGKQKKALSVFFLDWMIAPPAASPRLVSSAHGRLLHILHLLPAYVFQNLPDSPIWQRMKHLLQVLPTYTHFTLVTHHRTKQVLEEELATIELKERCHIISIDDQVDFTIWAQDPFIVVQDQRTGERLLMEPHSFLRSADAYLAELIVPSLGFRHTQLPLYYEGGNTLIGDDFWFLGADYAIETLQHIGHMFPMQPGESQPQAVQRMYSSLLDHSRTLLVTGCTVPIPEQKKRTFQKDGEEWQEHYYQKNEEGSVQPLFHLDMFISLAGRDAKGKYQLIVGDPRMAAHMLEEPLPLHAMALAFDNIAHNLERAGFKVYRNPLPLTYVDEPECRERFWYFATSNNALVEIVNEHEKRVWLPTYGFGAWKHLQKTDEANKNIWESLGFEVHLLPDFHPFAEHSGAVHCITKYLQRG